MQSSLFAKLALVWPLGRRVRTESCSSSFSRQARCSSVRLPALKLHAEMQMHSVPEITFNIIVVPQIDSARMSGLNEVLAVYLMAAKQVQGLHHRVTLSLIS